MLKDSKRGRLLTGAVWTIGMRWSIKAIGLVHTVLMARLLMPADYGIIAMAMLVVGLIQAMLDFGVATALLRKEHLEVGEINAAWTLKVIQSLIGAGLLVAVSPFAASYFKVDAVSTVLQVLAIGVVLQGLANIGMVLAQKAFNFKVEFGVNVSAKVVSVLVALCVAYWWRDYRALLWGLMSGYACSLVLSYVVHPYRPRWETRFIPEIWSVTKWLTLAGITGFFLRKTDEVVAARVGTSQEFGVYNVGSDLGQLPVAEVGPAMMKALLPILSSVKEEKRSLDRAVLATLEAANSITMPMAAGVAALAYPISVVLLGPQWSEAAQFMAAFSLIAATQFMLYPLNAHLILEGYSKSQSVVAWGEFLGFVCAALLMVPSLHLMGLVYARAIGAVFGACLIGWYAHRCLQIRPWLVVRRLVRPAVGAALVLASINVVEVLVDGTFLVLLVGFLISTLSFLIWMVLSWHVSGRPDGLESTLLRYADQWRGKARTL